MSCISETDPRSKQESKREWNISKQDVYGWGGKQTRLADVPKHLTIPLHYEWKNKLPLHHDPKSTDVSRFKTILEHILPLCSLASLWKSLQPE